MPRYTFLAFQLNSLLDKGESMEIDEAYRRIEDGSLLDWLEDRYEDKLDLSFYEAAERSLILEVFASMSGIDAKRKLAVAENGIALCLAYCIEVLQHPDAYEDDGSDG